jgi:hypothetical protein
MGCYEQYTFYLKPDRRTLDSKKDDYRERDAMLFEEPDELPIPNGLMSSISLSKHSRRRFNSWISRIPAPLSSV